MELQIQDLVTSIKEDGIQAGEKAKQEIIAKAEAEAQKIIEKAQAEAEKLLSEGKKKLELEKQSVVSVTKQACRDQVIKFKKELDGLLMGLLTKTVGKNLDSKTIGQLVVAALNGEDASKYELQVSNVNDQLKSELASQIKSGLTFKSLANIEGFKLVAKDGSGYFDFSEEQISQMLKPFLSNFNL